MQYLRAVRYGRGAAWPGVAPPARRARLAHAAQRRRAAAPTPRNAASNAWPLSVRLMSTGLSAKGVPHSSFAMAATRAATETSSLRAMRRLWRRTSAQRYMIATRHYRFASFPSMRINARSKRSVDKSSALRERASCLPASASGRQLVWRVSRTPPRRVLALGVAHCS